LEQAQLFGNFSRLDSRLNQGVEGAGLGLAITRSLCRAMGGDVTAQSEYGEGSTLFGVQIIERIEAGTSANDFLKYTKIFAEIHHGPDYGPGGCVRFQNGIERRWVHPDAAKEVSLARF
jgi:hypothetical protein